MAGHLVTAQHGHAYGTSLEVEYCGNVSQEGGLWASFFDWLLGSGVEHLLAFLHLRSRWRRALVALARVAHSARGKWTIGSTRLFSHTLPGR